MTVISATTLAAVNFNAPLQGQAKTGLFSAVDWQAGAPRWLAEGVLFAPRNFALDTGFGVWTASWCASADDLDPGDIKEGTRPEFDEDPFVAKIVYGFDHNPCGDLNEITRNETREHAEHNLELLGQNSFETTFAVRLLADAPAATLAATDIVEAIASLEAEFAVSGTMGVIHAGAHLAAPAVASRVLTLRADGYHTPLGHLVVFGGGYVGGLDDTLVATSPLFGWRTPAVTHDTINHTTNEYIALAEQAVLVGYEKAVAEVTIS